MERISGEQIGQRLALAREALGFSQADVAGKLGVSRPTVAAWEAGTRSLSSDQFEHLATLFGASVAELSGNQSDASLIAYRAHVMAGIADAEAPLNVSDRERVAAFFTYLEELANLRMLLRDAPRPLPDTREPDPRAVRAFYGLGTGPLPDLPTRWLDATGIFVYRVALDSTKLQGFACWHPNAGPAILLNVRTNPLREQLTALHEFGHLLSERTETFVSCRLTDLESPRRPVERQASNFAARLAVPEEGLKKSAHGLPRPLEPEHIVRLQRSYRVSFAVMLHQLVQAGELTPYLAAKYRKDVKPTLLARKIGLPLMRGEAREPLEELLPAERFPSFFILLVMQALDRDLISEDRAAALLGVAPDALWPDKSAIVEERPAVTSHRG
jgi:Zn-dependent peptidase ImmA (M78 family)/transcriptional regulator with XRE-family HTH domain